VRASARVQRRTVRVTVGRAVKDWVLLKAGLAVVWEVCMAI
jgi:hypothetical protein